MKKRTVYQIGDGDMLDVEVLAHDDLVAVDRHMELTVPEARELVEAIQAIIAEIEEQEK